MRDTILCLCDLTGVMARPWVEHGYQAVLVDPQHGCDHEDGAYLKLACTIEEAFDQISVLVRSGRLAFVAGFPPCTDMAVSGAQWFARKYEADHMFQPCFWQTLPHVRPVRLHGLRALGQLHEKNVPLDGGGDSKCRLATRT